MKNLILSLLLFPIISTADICGDLFGQLSYGVDRYYKDFNISKFEEYVDSFRYELKNGRRLNSYTANSKEEFLALVRAHQMILDPQGVKFVDLFKNGPTRKQKKVLKLLNGIRENKPLRFKTMKKVVSSYYYASIINDANFFQRHLQRFNPHKVVWDWINIAFSRQGVEQALVDIGFMKPGLIRSKFRQWLLAKAIAKEAILTGFGTAVGIKLFKIPTTHLPMTNFITELKLSDDFFDFLFENGTDMARTRLIEKVTPEHIGKEFTRLQRFAQFNMVYDVIAKAYNYGFVTFYFYFMFDGYPTTEGELDFEPIPMDENAFDAQEVRLELFSRWRFKFYQDEGRFPTQDEVSAYWEELEELTDEELLEIHEEMNREPSSLAPQNYMGIKLRAVP